MYIYTGSQGVRAKKQQILKFLGFFQSKPWPLNLASRYFQIIQKEALLGWFGIAAIEHWYRNSNYFAFISLKVLLYRFLVFMPWSSTAFLLPRTVWHEKYDIYLERSIIFQIPSQCFSSSLMGHVIHTKAALWFLQTCFDEFVMGPRKTQGEMVQQNPLPKRWGHEASSPFGACWILREGWDPKPTSFILKGYFNCYSF